MLIHILSPWSPSQATEGKTEQFKEQMQCGNLKAPGKKILNSAEESEAAWELDNQA